MSGAVPPGVALIDLHFGGRPGVIAAYLLDTGDGLAIVDTGPTSTLEALEAGLGRAGATLADVRHLLLTHIHFDHAGAAGTILERVPQARAYVHERGAPHLISPGRLYASAAQIYGDQMERLWGEMKPIRPEQLTVLSGGERLRLGGLDVDVLYTPGHAVHHVAYHAGADLFVGDTAGVRLAPPQTPRAPTPPPDIDLEVWRRSIQTLRGLPAQTLHLAHFGSHPSDPAHWDGLLSTMSLDAERVRAGLDDGQEAAALSATFTRQLLADLRAEAPALPGLYELACPPWMSVQGLTRYWQRRAARPEGR